MRGRKIWSWGVLFIVSTIIVGSVIIFNTYSVLAEKCKLSNQKLDEFSQANILFYCPGASTSLCSGASYGGEITWDDLDRCAATDVGCRIGKLLDAYALFAMNLQRWYGVPWELPFAVMITESGAGTEATPDYPNQKAKSKGYYNMMGLTWDKWFGETEHYEVEHEPFYICLSEDEKCQGNNFSYYDSISKMMLGFVIYHLRAGPEKNPAALDGLKQLEPNSEYENKLRDSIDKMLQSYCYVETVDGKKSACYTDEVMDIIRGDGGKYNNTTIQDKMKEHGWKNSTELAISENLPAGGYVSTDEFVQENGWGGWTDIREGAWESYGELGLPVDVAGGLGVGGTGCGTKLHGNCFKLDNGYDGGCTKDGFTFFLQSGGYENGVARATWGNDSYACGTIGDSGCGPSSAAMIITALTDQLVTPGMVADKIKERDGTSWRMQICNNGTNGIYMRDIFSEYGLSATGPSESFSSSNIKESVQYVNSELDKGNMMYFTLGSYPVEYCTDEACGLTANIGGGGHFIAIRGRSDDGMWLTFNSSDYPENDYRYDPESLLNAYFAHNKGVFTVVSK